MSETYDVASRLAQGRPAVETVQGYVWACHQLGYQHQDLTLHPAQVADWYTTEDGMDLSALQRGCLALDAAVRSSQEALTIQDRQLAEISAAWQGVGGQAAREFLRRHSDASATVAAAVRTAADAMIALREELWRAVNAKVDAVIALEGRVGGARAEWSAASETVTTGAGDRAAASELVDQAVKPFVDNIIGTEWLAAMRTATGSVTAAYERAVAEIDAEPLPAFGVPGDFGPSPSCPPADCDSARTECEPRSALSAAPAPAPAPALAAAPAATAPAAAWTPPAAPAAAPLESTPAPLAPPAPPMGAMGGGMPDFGGGMAGLGQQFADTLGGLLGGIGGVSGGIPEPPDLDLDEPEPEPEEEPEPEPEEEPEPEPEEEPEPEPESEEVIETGEAAPVEAAPAEEDLCEPAPEPPPPPPPAEPLPPAEPVAADAAAQTPCEIAAGEVPQVGEPPE